MTPEIGTTVGGKYRLLRRIGEGGMGAVDEAENTLTLKRAAIKWLHPRLMTIPLASQRLVQEARAAAKIRHPNVVDVYDVVLDGDSVFLVMELLVGEPLSSFLMHERRYVHEVVAALLPAMRGAAAAHAAGIVHRDIKPDNIFLARAPESGEVVPTLIDFGISRMLDAGENRLTHSGMTVGTPRYVSFEQLCGARDVDQRADVYAFGVIMYEAVVGRPPYDAGSLGEQAMSFVASSPPAPKSVRPLVPSKLDSIIRLGNREGSERKDTPRWPTSSKTRRLLRCCLPIPPARCTRMPRMPGRYPCLAAIRRPRRHPARTRRRARACRTATPEGVAKTDYSRASRRALLAGFALVVLYPRSLHDARLARRVAVWAWSWRLGAQELGRRRGACAPAGTSARDCFSSATELKSAQPNALEPRQSSGDGQSGGSLNESRPARGQGKARGGARARSVPSSQPPAEASGVRRYGRRRRGPAASSVAERRAWCAHAPGGKHAAQRVLSPRP